MEVDWENGFVETSAKDNINVGEVFRELLNQAKIKYNLGPSLRRNSARRQSLPSGGGGSGSHGPSSMVPTPAQLAHLQKKAAGNNNSKSDDSGGGSGKSKRNSCLIS